MDLTIAEQDIEEKILNNLNIIIQKFIYIYIYIYTHRQS